MVELNPMQWQYDDAIVQPYLSGRQDDQEWALVDNHTGDALRYALQAAILRIVELEQITGTKSVAVAAHAAVFEYTDDPQDPCPYCVHWQAPEGEEATMENIDRHVPLLPDGNVATRVYRQPHASCERSVIAYTEFSDT